jgi:hypothetical protein
LIERSLLLGLAEAMAQRLKAEKSMPVAGIILKDYDDTKGKRKKEKETEENK